MTTSISLGFTMKNGEQKKRWKEKLSALEMNLPISNSEDLKEIMTSSWWMRDTSSEEIRMLSLSRTGWWRSVSVCFSKKNDVWSTRQKNVVVCSSSSSSTQQTDHFSISEQCVLFLILGKKAGSKKSSGYCCWKRPARLLCCTTSSSSKLQTAHATTSRCSSSQSYYYVETDRHFQQVKSWINLYPFILQKRP